MAKTGKASSKRPAVSKNTTMKEGCVIRLSRRDCDDILKALKDLNQPKSAGTVARATAEVGAALSSPKVFKFIRDVHSCLCMSSPPAGKVVVIDVE